jgi:hypothetical protein
VAQPKLYAPPEYWLLTPEEKARICNGAGPKGYGWAVPDTLYGLSIRSAADIHDYMYHVGTTLADKLEADRVFLNNMLRIIGAKTHFKWLAWLRTRRANKYYWAVDQFGGPAFWNEKNPIQTMEVVYA